MRTIDQRRLQLSHGDRSRPIRIYRRKPMPKLRIPTRWWSSLRRKLLCISRIPSTGRGWGRTGVPSVNWRRGRTGVPSVSLIIRRSGSVSVSLTMRSSVMHLEV